MYLLLPLLTLTTTALTLTLPSHPLSKRQYCTSNPTTRLVLWSISHFSTFTTNHTASISTPEHYDYIAFTFHDANNGVSVPCGRTVPSSSNASIVDADNYYACGGSEVQYLYYGDGVTIREGVECRK